MAQATRVGLLHSGCPAYGGQGQVEEGTRETERERVKGVINRMRSGITV